ncbi:MAG: CoA transferase [Candidatus Tectomicrobia bacterium]|uniref:CoA transferase n=1 Tax=Tectimicrobiota bacterium TaxID=2528274 RepID=A0A932FVT1_UNCTE|nr:CoA transferase [Candidatus Tectomicrobia bacterium]
MRKEEFFAEAIPGSVGPLEGVRILEATQNYAGPNAGTVLVDMGAESIKIDMPGFGDLVRHAPPFIESRSELDRGAQHLSINRNKQNITLNLKSAKGREIFLELAQRVDIVIENFKPGTMEKWGLGYQDVRRVKPDIIYTSVSGYGQFGPYSHRPSYDAVAQAVGGLMSVNGYPDRPPTRTGNGLGDSLAGWQGAMASLAALHYRNRTGRGQHVDISQVDTILYTSDFGILAAANANYRWERMGSENPMVAPYNAYECKDGYVFIGVALDAHWARLCQIMGREELILDPRSRVLADRARNRELVNGAVNAWTKTKCVGEVVDALDEAQLVVAPILDFHQILEDPHIQEREMIAEVEHPAAGKLKIYGVAAKFSVTPARVRMPAPMMGQHNPEVYQGWLGYRPEQIDQLREEGVI